MKKLWVVLVLFAFAQLTLCQDVRVRIGAIEFFGLNGRDRGNIGDSMSSFVDREVSEADVGQLKAAIKESIRKVTGHPPTDVAFVCCDARGLATIYIGLANQTAGTAFRYKRSPTRSVRLPDEVVRLYDELMRTNIEAVQKNAGEDRSKGYSLSLYPPMRAKQLALRGYALRNEQLLHRVVLRSANSKQRAVAAEILGYARHSPTQIRTLVSASRDPDDEVRNNAVRALGVLAQASAAIAKTIPAGFFIDMLNSGIWTDRNKGSHMLAVISAKRDPRVLNQLRLRALASLIEMARWRDPLHSDDARMILGRAAGIPEEQLVSLVANGDIEPIISAVQRAR